MTINFGDTAARLYASFSGYLPMIVTIVAILIVGLIGGIVVDRVVRSLTRRLGIETLLERLGVPKVLYRVGYRGNTPSLMGALSRWFVYLLTIVMVADVAGLSQVSQGLNAIVAYLPRLFVALIFLMIGVWGADMMRNVVHNVVKGEQGRLVGTMLYYGVVTITVALVADQLGLETALINHIIILVLAGAVLAAALAVGASARHTLANVFARNYVSRLYRTGDMVRIDGIEGVVKAHSPTALVVVAEDFVYNVPYIRFMETTVGTAGEPIPVQRDNAEAPSHDTQDAPADEPVENTNASSSDEA